MHQSGGRSLLPKLRPDHDGYRKTELEGQVGSAKSVFQIGGAGAVGTGSIRGMPFLLALGRAGFSVWPFDLAGWPRVVEIYPRELTGPVNKSSQSSRHAYLVKPTLDAMEGVFGLRAWKGVPQPNDAKVVHLDASKRTVSPGEDTGATIDVWLA